MNNIAFFDFDGTITRKDTLFDFLRFGFGNFRFAFGIFVISPILVAFKLKIISNTKAKEHLLSWFFKNMSMEYFLEMANLYSLNRIDKITRRSATKLEIKNGVITGKISGKNCHGYEKARRILEAYDLEKFDYIYAYGDSVGDREMLGLANYKFYKFFKD